MRSTRHRDVAVRRLGAAFVSAALLFCATPSEAQTSARDVLADATLIRQALMPAWGSATVRMDGDVSTVRFSRTNDGIDVFEPTPSEWVVGAEALATPLRLLALALGAQPIEDGLAQLGLRLSETSPVHVLLDETTLGRRVGTDLAAVTFDTALPRLREVTVRLDGVRWVVKLRSHGGRGNGWFPSDVTILQGAEPVLEFTLLDLARSRADLAPLPAAPPAASRWAPARLPL